MTMTQLMPNTAYHSLVDGAALQLKPDAGLVVLTGADRRDFLHRMTTNNINALKPGQSAVTVLTSPTARVLFVFTVVCRNDELWLLPAAGEALMLARQLRGQIFFMDKVEVRDVAAGGRPETTDATLPGLSRARLMGPQAGAILAQTVLDLADAAEGAWQEDPATGLVAIKQQAYDVPGYELILRKDHAERVFAQMVAAGAVLLDDMAAYKAHRIELGRPAPGHELTSDYNPLEAGMAWACADNKGCYTGQEIIARQLTYDKVTKRLVGLRSAQSLREGATVTVNGQVVGTVTSASKPLDASGGASLALAILKRPHHAAGTVVVCGDSSAEVVDLPFR